MAQEIVKNLQSLPKHTKLGKVFKDMNVFMKSYNNDIQTNLTEIMASYCPTNDLEKVIKMRLIDHYKCYDEVLNILKSDDAFYITYALQCSWFFENSNFDPKIIIDSVFPYMSYSTRLKVLKKYSKSLTDHEVAVTFFNCLKQRYGLNTALIILPACGEAFIKHILQTVSIQIPVSILIALLSLYPSVVIDYITFLLESASTNRRVYRTFKIYSFEKIFLLLATKEPKKFAMLMEKYDSKIMYMKLGKRSTKHLVHTAFDSIKKHIHIYKRIFKWKFVISCLNLEQIADLQLALFPCSVTEFFDVYNNYCDFVSITASIKKSVRTEILFSNFNRAYNKPVNDYLGIMKYDLVENLPESYAEAKEMWIESKLPEVDNVYIKAQYVSGLSTKKSIPMLKKMIHEQTDASVRTEIVKYMLNAAINSNEVELISDVCHYVATRLRNDRRTIREKVICELSKYKYLIQISDDCWASIDEIINLMILNKEASGYIHVINDIISAQIHSRLKRNLPVDEQLEKVLKLTNDYYKFDLCINTPYEKQCLMWFLENFPHKKLQKVTGKVTENNKLPENLFIRLCQWNVHHKKERIELPGWLNEIIENLFSGEEYHYRKQVVLNAVKKDLPLKLSIYKKIFPKYINPSIVMCKLHEDPESVAEVVNEILKKILHDNSIHPFSSFFKQAKLHPHLRLTDLICSYSLNTLQGKCSGDEEIGFTAKRNSIRVLSVMLPTHKFSEIIAAYYPKKNVIDDFSEEGTELFQIQTEIASCLKRVNSPSEILDSISRFAVGDYLKLVVGSLTSVCLNTPEYKMLPLLKKWLDCPVSVRKHYIRTYFRIAPVLNTLELIVGLFENEKNTSLRILLFEHAQKFFISEPCAETFSVLKAVVNKLQPSDEAVISKLFDIENVPDEFISEYLQLLWDAVSIFSKPLLKANRCKIIKLIEPDILVLLSEEFCDVLITQATSSNDSLSLDLILFVVHYLLYSRGLEELNKRIEKVMSGIRCVAKRWNDYDLKAVEVFKCRKIISFLLDSLIRESFTLNEKALPPHDLIKKFRANLLTSIQETDIFEEILSLDISLFFLTSPDTSELMYHFLKFLEPLVDKIVDIHGNLLIENICLVIDKIFKFVFKDKDYENKKLSCSELLLKSHSKNCFIMGIKMLPTVITSDIQKYKEMLHVIFQHPDPVVKIFASKFYKDLSSSVKIE